MNALAAEHLAKLVEKLDYPRLAGAHVIGLAQELARLVAVAAGEGDAAKIGHGEGGVVGVGGHPSGRGEQALRRVDIASHQRGVASEQEPFRALREALLQLGVGDADARAITEGREAGKPNKSHQEHTRNSPEHPRRHQARST